MTTSEVFLVSLLIIFTLPWAVWRLAGGGIMLPLVVLQILAGVLLGPGVFGVVFPAPFAAIFTPEVITALNGLAWWAVMLFVFVAGLELDIAETWARRRETGTAAGLALAAPLILGSLSALILLQTPGWVGDKGEHWQAVLGIGMACAVTALPVLVLFLGNLGILRQPLGQRILRYASLDDVAIWSVLALILLDWERLGRQVGFVAGFAIAAVLMRRLLPRTGLQDRWYLGLIWLVACSFAADWAGLHYMVGAFLSGAVLEVKWFDLDRVDSFRGALLLALMPVYFLSTGLRTSWDIGGPMVFAAAALLLVASVAGKLAGVSLAGRVLGWTKGEAVVIGWLLQTKGLVMIIFANILLDKAIITSATFTALLLVAVASTMLTMPIVARRLQRATA